ncbi:hypothetical protein F511_20003 [Dorcoceras hygrometricum]|uniref:Uncharacterized protein n=1 Tax=Dorcoceras hygrometricum TaxID=472368 RepID=A0A2Z7DCK5_9LAMI|nr:hypothetical protein F511_20003 [Dorcoceras hygrometricum]
MEDNFIGLFVEEMDVVMTRGARSHVEFNFLCNLSVCEYYDNMLVRFNVQPSIRRGSIHIGLDRSMSHQELLEIFDQQLRDWPILDVQELNRRRLIEDALNTAVFLLNTMPPRHNVLVITYSIDIVSHRAIVIEEPDLGMVPATVSSILEHLRRSSIHIYLDRSMSHHELLEIFDQQLRDWPVLDVEELNRRRLIEDALNTAEFLLNTMPPRHNVLVITYSIDIVSHRAIVIEEPDLGMVPATVSSILEHRTKHQRYLRHQGRKQSRSARRARTSGLASGPGEELGRRDSPDDLSPMC